MVSRIQKAFEKKNSTPCLIPYITAGLPDRDTCVNLVLSLEALGARILELGIPFSDPILDGPVLQRANHSALSKGINTQFVISLVQEIREKTERIAIVIMSYLNPIYAYGPRRFFRDVKKAGADGIIIPDCPLEEITMYRNEARSHGLDIILMASPLTSPKRLELISSSSSGFLYYTTSKGITGPRIALPKDLKEKLITVKSISKLPVAAGFGISHKTHWEMLWEYCDGIVVGSALMQIVMESKVKEVIQRLEDFVNELIG